MWFPFFETGLEQPTGRFWQTDRRERTTMHRRVDAITTVCYPFAQQQTTHASKPHLNLCIPPVRAQRPRHGLSFLLYSPAHDGGHIKWPPVRAELAINLSRCPRSPGACRGLAVACGSLFGTGLTDTFRNLPPSLYRVSIKSRGQKTANMSTDTLLVAVILTTFKVI